MDGRAFLQVARRLALRSTEEDWRTGAGRAYYALFLEARAALARWGFPPIGRDPIHSFVRLRFLRANHADLNLIGKALDFLGQLRNQADYDLARPGRFVSSSIVTTAVQMAENALKKLDQTDQDTQRRAAAIASIRAAWP